MNKEPTPLKPKAEDPIEAAIFDGIYKTGDVVTKDGELIRAVVDDDKAKLAKYDELQEATGDLIESQSEVARLAQELKEARTEEKYRQDVVRRIQESIASGVTEIPVPVTEFWNYDLGVVIYRRTEEPVEVIDWRGMTPDEMQKELPLEEGQDDGEAPAEAAL